MKLDKDKEIELTKTLKEKDDYIRRLEGILFSMPVGILLVNENSEVLKVNRVLSDMTLKSIEEIIGEKGGDVLNCANNCRGCGGSSKCDDCGLKYSVQKTLTEGVSITGLETSMSQKVGDDIRSVWFKINTQLVEINDEKMVLLMIEDITKEKNGVELESYYVKKEKELMNIKESNKVKTQFLANISHELKTPLNIVFGVVQILDKKMKDKGENKTQVSENYVSIMKQNCYRLIKLINNLIDVTKFDENKMKMNLANKNIIEIVENITQTVAACSEVYEIETVFDTDIEELHMAVDQNQVERVMLNLLSNAIKFTDKGGKIHVDVESDKENVYINVADTGRGIETSKIEKIFDKFEQVDTSLTRDREGSGIGLTISKSIIEAHGGDITVDSCVDVGSNFKIRLPITYLKDGSSFEEEMKYKIIDEERIKLEFSDIYMN